MNTAQQIREHYRGVEERLGKRSPTQELTTVVRLRSKNESLLFELSEARTKLAAVKQENYRLRELLRENAKRYTEATRVPIGAASEILEAVCAEFDVPVVGVLGHSREARYQPARREVMYRLRTILHMTMCEIGRFLNRDHSTIVHGLHVHCKAKGIDPRSLSLPRDPRPGRE